MILIADSGSTKTDWCFAAKDQEPIYVQSLGINPYYQTSKNIADELEKTLRSTYDGPIEAIHYYGTGITGQAIAEQIQQIIAQSYPDAGEINVSSDLIGASRALYGTQSGIAVILGTGSNTGYFDGNAISEQIPPLGFWLGDEGSGGYLGKEFFKAYLRKDLKQETVALFNNQFGEMTRGQVLENAYQKPFPNRYFASYAEFIITNKTNPDFKELIESSLQKLFKRYLIKYRDIHIKPVGFVGSIAHYLAPEIETVASEHDIKVSKIIKSPIEELVGFHLE